MVATITVEEFADVMGMPVKTAYDFVSKQMPPHCKCKLGRRVRLLVDPLEAWIRAGGTAKHNNTVPQQENPPVPDVEA